MEFNILQQECHICDRHPLYRVITFWDQKVCAEHLKDGTLRCCSCHRFKEPEIKYEEVDGRQLCSFCYSITIIDPKECKLLIFEIVRMFYASCLHLDVDEDIRILLVDNDEMIKFYNEKPEIIPMGLATYPTTTNYSKLPIMGIKRCTKYEDRIKVEKKASKVTKLQLLKAFCAQKEMTRLLIQFGWPDVIMGMTLAHEMMHAWLRRKGRIYGLKLELERWVAEGICEVVAHKYGEWYCSRGIEYSYKTQEQLDYTKKLCQYTAEVMKDDPDEIYGKGFNQVMQAVDKYGFKTTLNHIVKARCLPHGCTNSK